MRGATSALAGGAGRNPEREATRLSAASSLLFCLGLGWLGLASPHQLFPENLIEEPGPVAIEFLEAAAPAPLPEAPPELEPAEAVERALGEPMPVEPEPAPEPAAPLKPEAKPRPPKAKPDRPKTKPSPPTAGTPSAPPPTAEAATAASKQNQAGFVAAFIRLVEKSKFYPQAARQAGYTGTVKVLVNFDAQGRVFGVSLMPGDYHPSLGEAALATMTKVKRRWPPKDGGPSALVVPIGFRLK